MWSKDLFSSISTTMWLTEDRPVPLLIPAPFRMASQNGNLTFPPLRTYRVTAGMARDSDSGGRPAGADPARGKAKTGDFRRFGRGGHANRLFWHVFDLTAG